VLTLLSGVRIPRQPRRNLAFSSIFSLINVEQSYVSNASVCSGVAFQPAHCIVSLKNLTGATAYDSELLQTT
jgi:hypothetical protein